MIRNIMASDNTDDDLVILRSFRDPQDAEIAKSVLESAGIFCVLRDDATIGMYWVWSNALGGVKVCVRTGDAAAAAQILDQGVQELFEVEGVGNYKQPRCPSCHSLNISLRSSNAPRVGLLLGVPIPPLSRRHWRCDSCGHEWDRADNPG